MNNTFAYADEDDKCYGLTGMAISVNVWDKLHLLREITLDGETSISFTPDFYFQGNPRLSAKSAWNEMVRQYQMITGLALGNVLCRAMVHSHRQVQRADLSDLLSLIEQEGRDGCSLDSDEIETIFNKTYNYLTSLFDSPQVAHAADRFAATLKTRRTMSGGDVEETLAILRL